MSSLSRTPAISVAFVGLALLVGCAGSGGNSGGDGDREQICIPSTRRCETLTQVASCRLDGSGFVIVQTCAEGEQCATDRCVPVVVDGDAQTDGDGPENDGFEFVVPDGDTTEEEAEEELAPGTCNVDRDCGNPVDFYCTPQHTCRRRLTRCEVCESDMQCGEVLDRCIEYQGYTDGSRRCARECATDDECTGRPGGDNWVCDQAERQCRFLRPAAPQPSSSTCCGNDDCEAGLVCNPTTLRCARGCSTDLECGAGRVCVKGTCGVGCTRSTECPDGFACDPTSRKCMPGQCFDKLECPPENVCDASPEPNRAGSCRPGCENDLDCRGSNECKPDPAEPTRKICVERTGCEHSGQCKLGFLCDMEQPDPVNPERGTCAKIPVPQATCCHCEKKEDCGQDAECAEVSFKCEQKKDCGDENDPDISCGTDGRCVRHGQVDQRKGYKMCIVPFDCKRFDDNHNQEGRFDCPRGYTCSKLQDQNGNAAGAFCFAECNQLCTWPSRYDQATCSGATPLVCCAADQPADVCLATP